MRLLIFVAIIAVLAYWYWSRSHNEPLETREADRANANAAIMQQCVNEEQRMQSAGALGGIGDVGGSGADAERVCAEKNHLYKHDGKWYSAAQ